MLSCITFCIEFFKENIGMLLISLSLFFVILVAYLDVKEDNEFFSHQENYKLSNVYCNQNKFELLVSKHDGATSFKTKDFLKIEGIDSRVCIIIPVEE